MSDALMDLMTEALTDALADTLTDLGADHHRARELTAVVCHLMADAVDVGAQRRFTPDQLRAYANALRAAAPQDQP